MNLKFLFLILTLLISNVANATKEAFTHSHGGRSHSHLLPSMGLNHIHNNGEKDELNEESIKKIIIYDDSLSIGFTASSKQKAIVGSTLKNLVGTMNIQYAHHLFNLDEFKGEMGNIIATTLCSFVLESHQK